MEIVNGSNLPPDIRDAINTFGAYGVVVVVMDREVSIPSNNKLHYPTISGKCFQRKETGFACHFKCDNCKLWDEEKK
jgi:hypothetical protein